MFFFTGRVRRDQSWRTAMIAREICTRSPRYAPPVSIAAFQVTPKSRRSMAVSARKAAAREVEAALVVDLFDPDGQLIADFHDVFHSFGASFSEL